MQMDQNWGFYRVVVLQMLCQIIVFLLDVVDQPNLILNSQASEGSLRAQKLDDGVVNSVTLCAGKGRWRRVVQ